MRFFALIIPLLIITTAARSNEGFGGNIGLVAGLGTKVNCLGVCANAYYYLDQFQANCRINYRFSLKQKGPRGKSNEIVYSLGALIGFGEKDTLFNQFTGILSNQTRYPFAFGYAFNQYMNDINTSQQTGSIGIEVNNFQFITENDIYAFTGTDQYRTGAFYIGYQTTEFRIGLQTTLWTGNALSHYAKRKQDSTYPSRYGYIDMSNAEYGRYSHGLLSIQANYMLPYQQMAQANAGIDAEQVRHLIQNKLIHDMYFLPSRWIKHPNPHIPMLTDEGLPYLFDKKSKIRKPSGYFNFFLNPETFY